jgi:hypothetical protein
MTPPLPPPAGVCYSAQAIRNLRRAQSTHAVKKYRDEARETIQRMCTLYGNLLLLARAKFITEASQCIIEDRERRFGPGGEQGMPVENDLKAVLFLFPHV